MSFFDFNEEVFANTTPPLWNAKTVVEFLIIDFNEDPMSGTLIVKCKIQNTEHKGRMYTHWIKNGDTEGSQKNRVQFSLAFWTKEELIEKTAHPAKLINRLFTAVAQAPREYNGKMYQSFNGYADAGELLDHGPAPSDLPTDESGMPAY